MNFAEKLVFLIHLTDSTNKKLAEAIHLDPSQVSRLRCGVRSLPRDAEYLPDMAAYFAGLCRSDYQQIALARQLGVLLPELPADQDTLKDALCRWLKNEPSQSAATESFLHSFERFHLQFPSAPKKTTELPPEKGNAMLVFSGEHGKRQAVDHLLDLTYRQGRPTQILLCSDEFFSPAAVRDYCQNVLPGRISALTRIGCSFQRIVRPDADLDYTFTSTMLWMPAYLSGKVETFYYPCRRDAVYHRTLVVARHVGAVFSTSVGTHSESSPGYLVTEPSLVAYYGKEFDTYLSMCESTVKAYLGMQAREYLLRTFTAPSREAVDVLQKNDSLSLVSLPPELYCQFTKQKNLDIPDFFQNYLTKRDEYFSSLGNKHFTDIINLAAPSDIRAGRAVLSVSCSFSAQPCYYLPAQYKLHLKNIVAMLQKYPNYRVIIADSNHTDSNMLIIHGENKALLIKVQEDLSLIKISDPDVTSALREYLYRTYAAEKNDRGRVIAELNELIWQI